MNTNKPKDTLADKVSFLVLIAGMLTAIYFISAGNDTNGFITVFLTLCATTGTHAFIRNLTE